VHALLEKFTFEADSRSLQPIDTANQLEFDQNDARMLARYWELGTRQVACRTLVRMDGDAATQFPAHLDPSARVSRDAVVRAHSTISLAMLALWPELIAIAGNLLTMFLPESPRVILQRHWGGLLAAAIAGDGRRPFPLREIPAICRRFLGWGRIVFESPAVGADAAIRSMVHPSGDIETTILAGATDQLLAVHAETVAQYIGRLEASLRRLLTLLRTVPVAVWLIVTGSLSAISQNLTICLISAMFGAVLGWVAKRSLQNWLRRRLIALKTVASDRIESPSP
jgi:hypothetical protein